MPHSSTRTWFGEIKATFSVGLPLISSYIIYASSGFIGTAMVAKLGEAALAASVLVGTIWFSFTVLFFGILNAVSVLVAHQYGANNIAEISEIMRQSFLLGLIILVLMTGVLLFVPSLLYYVHESPQVLLLSKQYLYAMMLMTPGLIALIIMEHFLTGINRTKLVLRMSMMVVPLEIPLIYLFVFGKLGFPACGVAGVGYGFATSYTVSAIGLFCYLNFSKHYRQYRFFSGNKNLRFNHMRELIKVGLPIGFMHVVEVSTFAITTIWMSRFGTGMLAAHQIALQFLNFATTLVFAMAQAVTVRIGHAVGEKDVIGVCYAAYTGMIINFFSMVLISFALFFAPNFFLRIDININDPSNAALLTNATLLLRISCVLIICDNFRLIAAGALRGLKNTRFALYSTCIGFWLVGLVLAYLLAFHWQLGALGIWWGLGFGMGFSAALVLLRLRIMMSHVNTAFLEKIMTMPTQ